MAIGSTILFVNYTSIILILAIYTYSIQPKYRKANAFVKHFWQAIQSGPNCKKLVGRLRPQALENQS